MNIRRSAPGVRVLATAMIVVALDRFGARRRLATAVAALLVVAAATWISPVALAFDGPSVGPSVSNPLPEPTPLPIPSEVTDPVGEVIDPVEEVIDPVEDVTDPITDPVEEVTDPITGPVEGITDPIKEVTEPIKEITEPIEEVTEPITKITEPLDEPVKKITNPVDATEPAGTAPDGSDDTPRPPALPTARTRPADDPVPVPRAVVEDRGGADWTPGKPISARPVAVTGDGDDPGVAREVARIAADIAKKVAFPLALAAAVVGFLVIQGRLDRKDPKLALAPVRAEDDILTFDDP